MKPLILYEGKSSLKDLDVIKKAKKIWRIVDIYEGQLSELFEITYPNLQTSPKYKVELAKFIKKRTKPTKKISGNWIYFPWNGCLIHTVNGREYFSLRTNRNRNLITREEQRKLYNFCIGVVGLSVGSSIAVSLAYQGIGKFMKLAECDDLETTNLNRVCAGVRNVGLPKIELTARQVYEIDPYSKLYLYHKGLQKNNLDEFINKKPKPKLIFEVIDDFEMKILLRLKARSAGVPIVMLANLGDRVLIDIERYDLDKKTPLFNGVIGDLPERILKKPKEDQNKYAVEIVGIENIPKRALQSVRQINKTLVGRPQLSSTVAIGGSLATYITRCIALGKDLPSGRRLLDIEKALE